MSQTKGNGNGDGAGSERVDAQTIFALITSGDCSQLTPKQKLQYYRAMCDAAGLDARTTPFEFVRFRDRKGGVKEILYAKKAATDQLNERLGLSHELQGVETIDGVQIARVRAKGKDGRFTDDIGAVAVGGLSGQELANAMMRTVTKAKRRATLSFSGLGVLDESELDTLPGAQSIAVSVERGGEPKQLSSSTASPSRPPAPPSHLDTGALDVLASALEGSEAAEIAS